MVLFGMPATTAESTCRSRSESWSSRARLGDGHRDEVGLETPGDVAGELEARGDGRIHVELDHDRPEKHVFLLQAPARGILAARQDPSGALLRGSASRSASTTSSSSSWRKSR